MESAARKAGFPIRSAWKVVSEGGRVRAYWFGVVTVTSYFLESHNPPVRKAVYAYEMGRMSPVHRRTLANAVATGFAFLLISAGIGGIVGLLFLAFLVIAAVSFLVRWDALRDATGIAEAIESVGNTLTARAWIASYQYRYSVREGDTSALWEQARRKRIKQECGTTLELEEGPQLR